MQFIPLAQLKEISGYRDRRSVKKWVERSLGIALHRVGKNWCVIESEYQTALQEKFAITHVTEKAGAYTGANAHEQAFISDLQKFLSDI